MKSLLFERFIRHPLSNHFSNSLRFPSPRLSFRFEIIQNKEANEIVIVRTIHPPFRNTFQILLYRLATLTTCYRREETTRKGASTDFFQPVFLPAPSHPRLQWGGVNGARGYLSPVHSHYVFHAVCDVSSLCL